MYDMTELILFCTLNFTEVKVENSDPFSVVLVESSVRTSSTRSSHDEFMTDITNFDRNSYR